MLTLSFKLRGHATRERLMRFCGQFVRALHSGAFDVAAAGDWLSLPAERIVQSGSTLTLDVPLRPGMRFDLDAARMLFDLPTELQDTCPNILDSVRGPSDESTGGLAERLQRWQRASAASMPAGWPTGAPVTVSIQFLGSVAESAQLELRANLSALEEIVATAPFLGCEADAYSAVGASQVLWLGPAHAHYVVEGVATAAPWPAMLCNQLFAANGPAPVRRVEILE